MTLKIDQEETENPPKINQKLVKNQSWRRLGGVLGRLGGQDRKMKGAVGFLGPSSGRLGGLLDLSWARLGGGNRRKNRPKNRSEL